MKLKVPRWWKRFRSAITGRFVTRKEAEARPNETVAEKVERGLYVGERGAELVIPSSPKDDGQ